MKKTYKIDVDCANCASKMEAASKKLDGVKDISINFMTQKLKVEFEDDADKDKVIQDVADCCKKIESDCKIYI